MTLFACHSIIFLLFNILFCCLCSGTNAARVKRLVGAEDASLDNIYYEASLKVDGFHICGGSIITTKHILTAAHCVADLFEPPYEELIIQTGTLDLKEGGDRHQVLNISWHPGFQNTVESTWYNDIAVLTLKDEIIEKLGQMPVNLPDSPAPFNTTAEISGWGRTEAGNPYLAHSLKKAEVITLDRDVCQQYHKATIHDGQICGRAKKEKVGICKGDSGGPLVVNDTIVGISSWTVSIPALNLPCGTGIPDVYTDVYHFLDFIMSVIHGH